MNMTMWTKVDSDVGEHNGPVVFTGADAPILHPHCDVHIMFHTYVVCGVHM